ncbi:MAG: tetratricopeptide repeat protein [Planctomycetes bacterium]|nr:tetratricopeptide repeat protein [Planctomycetota bacterium]
MRMSWRPVAWILALGLWPQLGCHQVPGDKSVQELRPIQQTGNVAKKQDLSAADITQNAWLKNVELLEKERKTTEAIALCEKMRQTGGPQALQASKKLAFLHYQNDDLDKAEHEYKLILQQNPKDADVLVKLGDIYSSRKQWGAAEKHYRDALHHRGDHAAARTGLGMTLAQLGDYTGSWGEFKKVVSDAEAYCEIAFVMKLQGKTRDAIRAYEEAIKLDPTMARAKTELSNLRRIAELELFEHRKQPLNVVTTPGTGKQAFVEPDAVVPVSGDGTGRSSMQRPTVAPLALPDLDAIPIDQPAAGKKK